MPERSAADQPPATEAATEAALARDIAALRAEVARLNAHRFLRIQNSLPRQLLYQFTNGVMTGLGTVVGATLVVSVLIFFLAQVELIPIIGDYATRIIAEIQRDSPR